MKTTKQLLKLILKYGNKNFEKGNKENDLYYDGYKGLCGFVGDLRDQDIITGQEYETLMQFFIHYRPQPDSPHYDPKSEAYYWEKGQWNPRKAWLEDHVQNTE
jgi:hypothetical protein